MKPITVDAERSYQILFTDQWASRLSELINGRRFVVITQKVLADQVRKHLPEDCLITAPEGENQKSLASYERIIEEVASRGLERNSLIIGLGGGATTDLSGFIAATYLRGVDWIAVPTTVAGMVDASIGGKTGLNISAGKNLVGSFYSPSEVIIDFAWLKTLPERDVKAGLAESIKCGFIMDKVLLDLVADGYEKNLPEIIQRSIQVKASIVSRDFKESYEREVLNYGHTLGHAIEKDSGYKLRHGEAISIGLYFAAELSHAYGELPAELVDLHRNLLEKLDLPTSYEKSAWPRLAGYLRSDKKRRSENVRFVTLSNIGRTGRSEFELNKLKMVYEDKVGR